MDPILHEWGSLLLRWLHVITAIAWIGTSFYFMHIDASLRPTPDLPAGKGGEVWEVHGGGFYQVRKWMVAPERLPDQLIWHKWESYSTWLSGFALLAWVYYGHADLYLIDPAVRDIGPLAAATIGNFALRLMPGYADVERALTFTPGMQAGRLVVGALASLCAGWVATLIARDARTAWALALDALHADAPADVAGYAAKWQAVLT